MENYTNSEEHLTCPYDKSHRILRPRMQYHLVRCAKNHGPQKMVTCKFNATHIVPEPELLYHHQVCGDRKFIETQIYDHCTTESKYPIPNIPVECEENWDNEYVPTYNPQEYLEKNKILRSLDVASRAQRRDFRQKERQRFLELNQQGCSSDMAQPSTTIQKVKLPEHPPAVDENENISKIRERIRLGTNKTFLQYSNTEN